MDTDLDVLDQDPFADDMADQLAAKAPRRWANRWTLVLAGLALLAGGFAGGAQVQKHFGTPATATTQVPTVAAAAPSGAAVPGGGQARGGGGATTGTVKLVDGTTVYITTADGQTVTVKTDGSTQVQLTSPGTVKDLTVGSTVTVTGRAGDDSSIAATRIAKEK